MPARFVPHALLLLMIALWGGSFAVAKHALTWLSPFAVVAGRFWLALLCLLPLVLRRGAPGDLRAALVPGAITGTALAGGYLMQTAGLAQTSASTGGFVAGSIPLLAALGGWWFLGGRLGPAGAAGLALGFLGMGCLVWPGGAAGARADTSLGIGLQVGSSVSYAAHILLLSHFGRRAPAAAFTFWQVLLTAVVASAGLWITGPVLRAGAPPAGVVLFADLLYLGPIATALGIAVQARVQPAIPAMHVPLLFATQPLFAALAGWSLLGDRLGALQVLGGALIVAGIVVASRDPVPEPPVLAPGRPLRT
ncbi:MAG TPA: DMT family transporter [Planctomycetota bacterium]|nr:DMT family transporter [Planctomycetota bacterium]